VTRHRVDIMRHDEAMLASPNLIAQAHRSESRASFSFACCAVTPSRFERRSNRPRESVKPGTVVTGCTKGAGTPRRML
jgi:hypothetical protein